MAWVRKYFRGKKWDIACWRGLDQKGNNATRTYTLTWSDLHYYVFGYRVDSSLHTNNATFLLRLKEVFDGAQDLWYILGSMLLNVFHYWRYWEWRMRKWDSLVDILLREFIKAVEVKHNSHKLYDQSSSWLKPLLCAEVDLSNARFTSGAVEILSAQRTLVIVIWHHYRNTNCAAGWKPHFYCCIKACTYTHCLLCIVVLMYDVTTVDVIISHHPTIFPQHGEAKHLRLNKSCTEASTSYNTISPFNQETLQSAKKG